MEPVEKDAEMIKTGEKNLFTLGHIERLVSISNEYKANFNNLSFDDGEDLSENHELSNFITNMLQ